MDALLSSPAVGLSRTVSLLPGGFRAAMPGEAPMDLQGPGGPGGQPLFDDESLWREAVAGDKGVLRALVAHSQNEIMEILRAVLRGPVRKFFHSSIEASLGPLLPVCLEVLVLAPGPAVPLPFGSWVAQVFDQVLTDETLMDWVRDQQVPIGKAAFSVLFCRWFDLLVSWLQGRFGLQDAVAKEVAQDTFLNVWRSHSSWKGGAFAPWLRTIAHHCSVDQGPGNHGGRSPSPPGGPLEIDVPGPESTPLEQLVATEDLVRLTKAVLLLIQELAEKKGNPKIVHVIRWRFWPPDDPEQSPLLRAELDEILKSGSANPSADLAQYIVLGLSREHPRRLQDVSAATGVCVGRCWEFCELFSARFEQLRL